MTVRQRIVAGTAATLSWQAVDQDGEPSDPGPASPDASPASLDAGVGGPDATTNPPDPSAPRFLTFGTNVTSIGWGGAVTFTAVLTDPDGIDDLIGGSLTSPDGAILLRPAATESA